MYHISITINMNITYTKTIDLLVKFGNQQFSIDTESFSVMSETSTCWGSNLEDTATLANFLSSDSFDITTDIDKENYIFNMYLKNNENNLVYTLTISKNITTFDIILETPDESEYGYYDVDQDISTFDELFI